MKAEHRKDLCIVGPEFMIEQVQSPFELKTGMLAMAEKIVHHLMANFPGYYPCTVEFSRLNREMAPDGTLCAALIGVTTEMPTDIKIEYASLDGRMLSLSKTGLPILAEALKKHFMKPEDTSSFYGCYR